MLGELGILGMLWFSMEKRREEPDFGLWQPRGKTPGLGHPVAMDLGIFDSWWFRFSWKIPCEGENEGSELGNLGLDLVLSWSSRH